MNNAVISMKSSCLYKLPERLSEYNRIYIYGAGMVGKFIFNYLKDNGIADKVASYVVSANMLGGGEYLNLYMAKRSNQLMI